MVKAPKQKHVIVMGGGLAGLAAAYELSDKNFQVSVIEKWDSLGGLARTIEKNGFRFDTGPHRWYTKNDQVNQWMLNLLGNEVIRVPRLTRIYFDGKFFNYPIKLMNALKGIGIGKALLSVLDYIVARTKSRLFPRKMFTMEDGYINQFGRTLYEIFFKRYSEKLWGQKCTEISIDWVGQRTRGLNIHTLIKEMLFKSKSVVSLVDEFSYPRDGIGRLADKMAKKIMARGGEILLSSEVMNITSHKNSIVSIEVKTAKGKQNIQADYFISSIPITDLVSRLNPSPPSQVLGISNRLKYRDELQVVLFVNKSHIVPDTWIYVHPKEIPYMRVMEMDNWSDRLSKKGTTSIVFEIACNEGDATWRKKDSDVIKIVEESFIQEFKLVSKKDIIGGFIHRVPKEYPVYHIGYREDVDKVKKYIKRFQNLQLVGRNGTFRYNNMDHSVEMGLYAAWNIIEGQYKHDIESVNIEREYLEEKKLETIEDERVEEGENEGRNHEKNH